MEKKVTKSTMIAAAVEAVIAVFMILAVKVFAPVCTGMLETTAGKQVPMRCHYAAAAAVILAVLWIVNAAVCFAVKQKTACGIMTIAIAVCVFVILNSTIGMGICANPDMACNITAPYMKLCATLEMITGAVSVFLGMKESK